MSSTVRRAQSNPLFPVNLTDLQFSTQIDERKSGRRIDTSLHGPG